MAAVVDPPRTLGLHRYEGARLLPYLRWQAVSFMRIAWPWIEGGKPRDTYDAGLRPTHFVVVEE